MLHTVDLTIFFFFFQAEDGIRDGHVTGVQTCALPILVERIDGRPDVGPGLQLRVIGVLEALKAVAAIGLQLAAEADYLRCQGAGVTPVADRTGCQQRAVSGEDAAPRRIISQLPWPGRSAVAEPGEAEHAQEQWQKQQQPDEDAFDPSDLQSRLIQRHIVWTSSPVVSGAARGGTGCGAISRTAVPWGAGR